MTQSQPPPNVDLAASFRDTNDQEASLGDTGSSRSIQRRHHQHHQPASPSLYSTLVSHAPLSQCGSTLASRSRSTEGEFATSTINSSERLRHLEASRPESSIGPSCSSRNADRLEYATKSQRDQYPNGQAGSGADTQKMQRFRSSMHKNTKAVDEFAENLEAASSSRYRRKTKRNTRK